ncbi:MAG: RNA methyltransferase [Crocinitomicaceae bacterium]|nr:RNA methyltransferase [Crocinitomicaceae bacterium]|tara:strand:+ start:7766 stop:8497 length:732 start_codon:yes stop_codon:yes gene_type:complete
MQFTRSDLKIYSSLNRKSKREQYGLFIAEGIKACKELIDSEIPIKALLSTEENNHIFKNSILISGKDAQRISNQKNHSGVIAIGELPKKNNPKVDPKKDVIVLENINDPGNLGTILRTLDWFGFSQVVCSKNSVDSFNPKTIMASMGSVFRLQPIYTDISTFVKQTDSEIYGAFMEGKSIYDIKFNQPSTIIFGNESNGISSDLQSIVNTKIAIPGKGTAESLNLSNSCSIVVSELFRQRLTN